MKTLGESDPSRMKPGGPSCEPYNSAIEVYSSSFRTGIPGFQHQNVVHEFGHHLLGKGHSVYYGISGIQENKLRRLKEDMQIQKADELGAYYYKFIHK